MLSPVIFVIFVIEGAISSSKRCAINHSHMMVHRSTREREESGERLIGTHTYQLVGTRRSLPGEEKYPKHLFVLLAR